METHVEMKREFIRTLEKEFVNQLFPTKISKDVFEIKGRRIIYVYLKARGITKSPTMSWGATKNILDKIPKYQIYVLVLLAKSSQRGYVINRNQVEYYIENKYWTLKDDGDYNINPGNIPKNKFFESSAELLLAIKKEIS